jgi:uncharacterized protein YdeI (YjbR/CyaY-like superfamily)
MVEQNAVPVPSNVTYFKTPADLRKWFKAHHASAEELWVGYYKKASGHPSVTWPESVDEALCVGWIDGIRKRHGATSYKIRFTPRRKGSAWSAVNLRKVEELKKQRRMRPAGLKAFDARDPAKCAIYSYEQVSFELPEPYRGLIRKNRKAWTFFQTQPPGYRKIITRFIMSAKKEETRLARVRRIAELSAEQKRLV